MEALGRKCFLARNERKLLREKSFLLVFDLRENHNQLNSFWLFNEKNGGSSASNFLHSLLLAEH